MARKTPWLMAIGILCSLTRLAQAQPSITFLSTNAAFVGSTITVSGSNFSTTPTNNIVWFGAVRATVTSATATNLTVTVPVGATYAPVSVTMNGLTAYSANPFDVTFPSSRIIDSSSFSPKVEVGTASIRYDLAIADLDGDGKPDVAAVENPNSAVSIFRNITAIGTIDVTSFSLATNLSVSDPYYLAIADVDGDGKKDLLVTSHAAGGTVAVFRNLSSIGNISFATPVQFSVSANPQNIAAGDFDGDGKPDVVVGYSGSPVSVLRNASSGTNITFDALVNFTVGPGTRGLTVGDLDGDGKHGRGAGREAR